MSFRRREKPLHERLAEQGGMTMSTEVTRDVAPWNQAGVPASRGRVNGTPSSPPRPTSRATPSTSSRSRIERWSSTRTSRTTSSRRSPTRSRRSSNPPYRAEGTRRDDRLWAVGASKIAVVSIAEEIGGDTVELAVREGVVTQLVDGAHGFGSVPELEALGAGMPSFVVRADRIDGDLWEVVVLPL